MKYNIEFSQQEIQIVLGALQELPLRVVAPLFGRIHTEVQKQDEAAAIPIEQLMATAEQGPKPLGQL